MTIPLYEEKRLEEKLVFFFFLGRVDKTRKTYADTRWGFQRWLFSRGGHCRRACTYCSLLPLCCVCSYKPACCARSSRTRWHGRYTCTWVGRGEGNRPVRCKGPPHNDRAHCTVCVHILLLMCETRDQAGTNVPQSCSNTELWRCLLSLSLKRHCTFVVRLSGWCLCFYPACPLIQRARVCSTVQYSTTMVCSAFVFHPQVF